MTTSHFRFRPPVARVSSLCSLAAGLLMGAMLACGPPRATIADIQGSGHTSPRVGERVTVSGVVVAVRPGGDDQELVWIEEPDDGDPATSRGLLVTGAHAEVGEQVTVVGTVRELPGGRPPRGKEPEDPPRYLTVTALEAASLQVDGDGLTPAPVVLGRTGRPLPEASVYDDDGLSTFEPATDTLDFWESLEGTRVRIPDGVVVGPTHRGEVMILADSGGDSGLRTARGGLLVTPGDQNPERIAVADWLSGEGSLPAAAVGDRFAAPVDGIVHYARSRYAVMPLSVPALAPTEPPAAIVAPAPADGRIRIATYNVLNLSAHDDAAKFARLGHQLVHALGAPDLVALQEVQDDNGTEDDGHVSAEKTLARLAEAVAEAGGPAYRWLQIDPENNRDGGQGGGNIRVAFLYDPRRVEPVHTAPPADLPARGFDLRAGDAGAELLPSPARLLDPSFDEDVAKDWSACRKPLVAQFRSVPEGAPFFAIAVHLTSKGGDDRYEGSRQPPMPHSETQRVLQATAVADTVRDILAVDPEARVVVLGDFNEYGFRPPVQALEQAGLENLTGRVPQDQRYTYVYRGDAQVLDHFLVSPAWADDAEIAILHINADLPDHQQASDHDPVVASLALR